MMATEHVHEHGGTEHTELSLVFYVLDWLLVRQQRVVTGATDYRTHSATTTDIQVSFGKGFRSVYFQTHHHTASSKMTG